MDARRHAAEELRANVDPIVRAALDRQNHRWPGLFDSFSASQMQNTIKDTGYHVSFVATALWADEQIIFDDYVRWVRVLFENLGLPVEWLTGSLADVRDAVGDVVTPAVAHDAASVIDTSLGRLDGLSGEPPSNMDPAQPLAGLAVRYLGAVLGGDRTTAVQAIIDAVEGGVAIGDVYRHVLERAQLELGRLWHLNKITVAQEHYATAVTQMVMAQLYRYMFTGEHTEGVLVAACVGDELHELGLRMVTDHFEMAGWDTHFIGANTPTAAIVDAAAQRKADVIALSATMPYHVPEVAAVVGALKADERTAGVPIIVGGYPFNLAPGLFERVGADAYAPDARRAVETAATLVGT